MITVAFSGAVDAEVLMTVEHFSGHVDSSGNL